MASIAKYFSLIFLLTLLFSLQIHARDGQFFNKVPSNNGDKETQTVIPNKEQEPNFMPENENGAYGLYGHDSVSTPTPTITNTNNPNVKNLPNSKYLPKNYNPVSYVTVSDHDTNENNSNKNEFEAKHTTATTTSNNNQLYSGPTNYRSNNNNNNQEQYYHGVSDYSTKYNNKNNQQQQFYSGDSNNQNYYNNDDEEEQYYNAANTYYKNNNDDQQQGLKETRLSARSYSTNPTNYNNNQEQSYSINNNNYNTGNANYRVHQQQGMSDTRFLGYGKFYYDVNAGKHARDPYENAREFAAMNQKFNTRNTYGNNEYNNNGFENEEFQDEENLP